MKNRSVVIQLFHIERRTDRHDEVTWSTWQHILENVPRIWFSSRKKQIAPATNISLLMIFTDSRYFLIPSVCSSGVHVISKYVFCHFEQLVNVHLLHVQTKYCSKSRYTTDLTHIRVGPRS
jgi:hypothetical protein